MIITQQELKEWKITKEINDVIFKYSGLILVDYANWYKDDPKGFLRCFINNVGIKMIACLVVFTCRKNGILKELEGQKDFSDWVNKQNLEERWKPVLSNFILILWGVINR